MLSQILGDSADLDLVRDQSRDICPVLRAIRQQFELDQLLTIFRSP